MVTGRSGRVCRRDRRCEGEELVDVLIGQADEDMGLHDESVGGG